MIDRKPRIRLRKEVELPFALRQGTRIQDRDHPNKVWTMTAKNVKGGTDDYALISRLVLSKPVTL